MAEVYIPPKGYKEVKKYCKKKKSADYIKFFFMPFQFLRWLVKLPFKVVTPNIYYKKRHTGKYIIPMP